MEDKTFITPAMANKYTLRSTGEEVEVIDTEIKSRGERTDEDWVTYIDSKGVEHIKEHLNIQLDFRPVANDIWDKMLKVTNFSKYPTAMNNRKFELAKELVVHKGMTVSEAVAIADALVKQVGVDFE